MILLVNTRGVWDVRVVFVGNANSLCEDFLACLHQMTWGNIVGWLRHFLASKFEFECGNFKHFRGVKWGVNDYIVVTVIILVIKFVHKL